MTRKIEITVTDSMEQKLKLLKIWFDAGQPVEAKTKNEQEMFECLVNEMFSYMTLDPVGQKVLW